MLKKAKCLVVLFIGLICSVSMADELIGKVIGVTDGDTITILDQKNEQYKIRLAGIDAPEKKQAFGNVSKKSLSDLVYNKQVRVEFTKTDRYGRYIGKVMYNELDINKLQIERGMAWFYRKYKKELVFNDRISYLHAEEYASGASLGLWVDTSPIAPWEFRKQ